jgi:hypothetical protein
MGSCVAATSLSNTTQASYENSLVYLVMINRIDLIKLKIFKEQIDINTRI